MEANKPLITRSEIDELVEQFQKRHNLETETYLELYRMCADIYDRAIHEGIRFYHEESRK